MSIIPLTQKFHSKDGAVETTERRSAKLMSQVEVYTMADLVETIEGEINVVPASDASTIYDTKAQMVSDTNLSDGDVVVTRGYSNAGDKGGVIYTIAAAGTGDEGSVITLSNGKVAEVTFGGMTTPQMWGAIANDASEAATNTAAFNAMFAYVESVGGAVASVDIPTGTYYIDGTIQIPRGVNSDTESFMIECNNSTFKATSNDITFFKREYYAAQESGKVSIFNAVMDNNGMTGVVGIDIQGSYASKVINCEFKGLAVGLELGFALHTIVDGCKFGACTTGAYIGLKDRTLTNKQSNVSQMTNCRFYSAQTSDYALMVDRTSGVKVAECIFEGWQPTEANIFFDGQSSTVNDLTIDGCHAESAGHANSGNNTHVKFTGGARLKLHRVFAQVTTDYSDSSNPVNGREIAYVTGGNSYLDVSLYYYNSSFSFRNDGGSGYFYMLDEQLNTTLPNDLEANPFIWTGTYGQPRYYSIKRADDGIAKHSVSSYRMQSHLGGYEHELWVSAAGGGAEHIGEMKAKVKDSWAYSYVGYKDRAIRGRTYYCPVHIDNKLIIGNQGYNVTTSTNTELHTLPRDHANYISLEMAAGDSGRGEQTLCPVNGRTVAYTDSSIPATANDTGKKGEIRSDATHMYVCVADDSWIKVALTSF